MRLYRTLLHLYPASFRNEYGAEMCAIFARRRRQAAGPIGVAALWLDALSDVVVNAARVHAEMAAQDVRYSLRTLARTPAFAVTAVVVSALGVGATTVAFSITDHVLLRPLPFEEPDRLVRLYQAQLEYTRTELSPANYRDWRRMATVFESMGAFANASLNLVGGGEPQRVSGLRVTFDVLPMLGIAPALGRFFTAEEDAHRAAGTVILGDGLWQGRFGGDPAVLGRTILLDDEPYLVIGVMPRGFYFPRRDVELWIPARFGPEDFEDRGDLYLYGIARLRDDVSVDEARSELQVVAARLEREYPKENARTGATVIDLRSEVSRQSELLLVALFGASLCVLLIACTNLANLLLARALARRRELAVRAAMGAGRDRLVRQMLTEALILAAVGGAIGVLIAIAATPLVARLVPNELPIAEVPGIDLRMLAFAAAVTIATGIGFGVAPALRAARVDAAALAEGARTGHAARAERLRSMLVVAEVTASVVLLVSAGLLIRALWVVQQVDPGFRTDGVLTLRTPLPLPKYESTARRARFYEQVTSEIRALPGVTHAAYISFLPLSSMRGGIWAVTVDGREATPAESPKASLRFVTPGYFQALRIPLLSGRDIDERDTESAPTVAVVSESFAAEHWPGQPAIGRRFLMAFRERLVVGVVGDVRVRGLERPSEPQVYASYRQVPDGSLISYTPRDLVVRASTPPASLVPAIRRIVAAADPAQPIVNVQRLADLVDAETAPRATQLRVLGAFAALALLLAGIGLHGLLAFTVSARVREIGVRIALGAASSTIIGMILRHALLLAGIGLAAGVALAYAAGRAMRALLAGISPADTATFGAAVVLVAFVSLAGALVPAIRAVRIDPLTAIRAE